MADQREAKFRTLLVDHTPAIAWARIESPLVSPGIPDLVGSHRSMGSTIMVELKYLTGTKVPLRPDQASWLRAWPGRCFVVARDAKTFMAWRGTRAIKLKNSSSLIETPDFKAPMDGLDWGAVVHFLFTDDGNLI